MTNCNSTTIESQYADAFNTTSLGLSSPYRLSGLITLTNPLVESAGIDAERLDAVLSGGTWEISAPGVTLENSYQAENEVYACVGAIYIRRNPNNYMTRDHLSGTLVVWTGLFALFLDPFIPPLLGGRCSLLIVTMLITINKMSSRNLHIGRVTYLLDVDYIAMTNVCILLVAVLSSVGIHVLNRKKMIGFDKNLDVALVRATPRQPPLADSFNARRACPSPAAPTHPPA